MISLWRLALNLRNGPPVWQNIGSTPATVYGSLHGPDNYNETAQYRLSSGVLTDDFHVYAVEWLANQITFYVDGILYETQTNSGAGWVFNVANNPFFIILNVAVGGDWPGPPDASTKFPQDMLVDYVRVYQPADTAGPAINTAGVVDAATFGAPLAPGSLATIFGQGLAATTNSSTFDASANAFPESASGVEVFVNGAASPLMYLSQILPALTCERISLCACSSPFFVNLLQNSYTFVRCGARRYHLPNALHPRALSGGPGLRLVPK